MSAETEDSPESFGGGLLKKMTEPLKSSASTLPRPGTASGGFISPVTAGGWVSGSTGVASVTTSPRRPPNVRMPSRLTKKILIAMLDDDDEESVVWGKRLKPQDFAIEMDPDTGVMMMTLKLSLEDVYENEKKPEVEE